MYRDSSAANLASLPTSRMASLTMQPAPLPLTRVHSQVDGDAASTAAGGYQSLPQLAKPLLDKLTILRRQAPPPHIPSFRSTLVDAVKSFEKSALLAGHGEEGVLLARYVLCAALDESILSTAWGPNINWNCHNLLAIFHGETWGGERIFEMLQHVTLSETPQLELVELFYLCLSLGTLGKYRTRTDGLSEIHHIQNELYQMIRHQKGEMNNQLACHALSNAPLALPYYTRQKQFLSLPKIALLTGALILSLYCVFSYFSHVTSTSVYQSLQAILDQ